MRQLIARFITKLYFENRRLKKECVFAVRISKFLRRQWHRDRGSLFKKKLYEKSLEMKNSVEWSYFTMNKSPVYTKIKTCEEIVCGLLDKICSGINRDLLRVILEKSMSSLYYVIKQLIHCNFVGEAEMKVARRKSRFLLEQFPIVRREIFRKSFKNKSFDDFIQELKEEEYACLDPLSVLSS